jgi:hypothetical protein
VSQNLTKGWDWCVNLMAWELGSCPRIFPSFTIQFLSYTRYGSNDPNNAEKGLSHHPGLTLEFVRRNLKQDWNFESLLLYSCFADDNETGELQNIDGFSCVNRLSFKLRIYFRMRKDFLDLLQTIIPLIRFQKHFKEIYYKPDGPYEQAAARRFNQAVLDCTK